MQFWSDEDGVRRSYPLREGSLVIGRQPSCDIVIPGRNVSKRHVECFVERGVITIRDLGSANGTFVNGNTVTTCVLKDGDKLLLGGYQLVLDAELPLLEAMPGAQAVQAAPPTQPQPPPDPQDAQQEAPSFAEEPASDDTPVDGTFMPQTYDPQSLQPQVVARDGHMYLRDPRTNREVEIVPRGASPAADLSGYYAGQEAAERKRNMYLVAGAIAVGLLMIIALAWTSGSPDNEDQPQRPAFPREKYNEITEKSIDQMSAGNFKEAAQQLTIAHKGRPTYGVAAILRDIAREWENSGKTINEFNWLSVESSLRELMKNRWSTAKVRNFASGRIDWTYDVQHHQDIAAQALKLLNAGEPEKALAEFQKLPKHSIVYRKHEGQIADTVTAACAKRLRLAKDALDRGKWQAAIQEYAAAKKYASDVHKATIARGVRIAKKRMLEEQRLTEANERFRENEVPSLQAALKLLDEIEDGGPLGQRKAAMRVRIEAALVTRRREEMALVANAHYEAGRGGEAIKIITDNQLTELYPLRTRIERITRLLREAQAACDAKDYDLAKSKWNDAALEESSAGNAYRKAALDKLKELADRRKEIALDYRAMGDVALQQEKNPAKARKLYMKAMRWDPRATVGKSRLADMRHLAEVFYHQARDLRRQQKPAEAIELFEKVRQYVAEGTKFHEMATRQLGELRADLPK